MRRALMISGALLLQASVLALVGFTLSDESVTRQGADDGNVTAHAERLIREGEHTFRYDTFGDEAFWGDALGLHKAIEGANLGGVGPGVSPRTALAVGLKVDVDALPPRLQEQIREGKVDLDNPATTLALLKLNAVVGVTGIFNSTGALSSIGIQCASCHSTVDNSFAPGIGHRLDGWANRDLNVGAIVNLSPDLSGVATLLGVDETTVRKVLASWGPGKFDAEVFMDGKGFRPDGASAAVLIPPAFGLAGVNLHTWTGWGGVTHWNAFVANLEMHGKGTFYDPRLNDASRFPVAARAGFGNKRDNPDLITSKLAALQVYQLILPAPKPPEGTFDEASAARGEAIFNGRGKCASCHVPPLFTEPGWNMHAPGEIGIDDFQAARGPEGAYRTAPLKGLWTHMKGGFYHDGRFATLSDVVDHYSTFFSLGLSSGEKSDLVEYLKSLGDVPVNFHSPEDAGSSGSDQTDRAVLEQNYPNPFNPSTVIRYELRSAADVRLNIYSVTGQLIRSLVSGTQQAGRYSVTWEGTNELGARVASGVYLYRLEAAGHVVTRKTLFLK